MINQDVFEFTLMESDFTEKREKNRKLYFDSSDMTFEEYQNMVIDIPMTFNMYQQGTRWTASYPENMPTDVYLSMGVAGETGELVEVVKKLHRNNNGVMTPEIKEKLIKEAGDVLYYLSALMLSHDIDMEDVAKTNQLKLVDRWKRKVVCSEGDNR